MCFTRNACLSYDRRHGSLDGLSGSSDDGIEQSQLFALNADVLGLIALSLKPAKDSLPKCALQVHDTPKK